VKRAGKRVASFLAWAALSTAGTLSALSLAAYFTVMAWFPLPIEGLRGGRASRVVTDREGSLLRAWLAADGTWALPATLDDLTGDFIAATIAVEDQRFMTHPGVDPVAMARALVQNVLAGRVVSGASTLTMQTVRLLERRPRDLPSKIIEAAHALALESRSSKWEILEFYVNNAPYGGNIRGIRAAAFRYFHKHPFDLTLAESALLAGLPQSPTAFRPDRFPERARKRRDHVLARMHEEGLIDAGRLAAARAEPVEVRPSPFPFLAPHFTQMAQAAQPGAGRVVTSLDSGLQSLAESAVRSAVASRRPDGISNAALVVIENATGEVRALVGSSDFCDEEASGQVNGALAPRSPGSTLKPFTFALGFASGLIAPSTILADLPMQAEGWTPENFDGKFRGPVSASRALVASLNLPAVEVLARVGHAELYHLLKRCGISTLQAPPDAYGLSLTLGSAEVSLLELTNAYAALARGGLAIPYSLLSAPREAGPPRRVLPEGAAYLVAEILSDTSRLGPAGGRLASAGRPRIAWKTGTSSGNRDAWTVAWNPEYTVGVWMGNFDGRPAAALAGLHTAAPLALKVFGALYVNRVGPWYPRPQDVVEGEVCARSGQPAGEQCPHRVKGLLPALARARCEVHRAVPGGSGDATVEVWPNELHTWFQENDPTYLGIAASGMADPDRLDRDRNQPVILSPIDGFEYVATAEPGRETALPLAAYAAWDSENLFWFVDGVFLAEADLGRKVHWPMSPGAHRITCADRRSRSTTVEIQVMGL
jgi:penicillin-binding protein 1C